MGSFEKDQQCLQKLMDELLSDEEPDPFEASSSDEYEPDGSDSSSSSSSKGSIKPIVKKKKTINHPISFPDNGGEGSSRQLPKPLLTRTDELPDDLASSQQVNRNDSISDTIEAVIHQFQLDISDEDEELVPTLMWQEVTGQHLKDFPIQIPESGVVPALFEHIDKSPVFFFKLMLDEDLINNMVTETNRFAAQKKESALRKWSRINKWKDTNSEEIMTFIGLQIWMGLFRAPKLADYWSKKKIYLNKIAGVMSRNRFELLLANWHFQDNQTANTSDRLHKLGPLLEQLKKNFQKFYIPKEQICVDETLVPFRGRLAFVQYIKNKRHKFGVKLYKLCLEGGYTYDLKIYCGKDKVDGSSVPTNIVMNLCEPLLDCGRCIYVDNYYTSMELAHKLLERKTHLVGTLRKNRKNNPKDVINKRLKKGESYSQESNTGVVITKWQDKRDVLTLSTKHTGQMVTVPSRRNAEAEKPNVVADYNTCKAFIDLSDQIKAYSSALRKGIKWYIKIAVELLLGAAMVNAYILFKAVTGQRMTITTFREEVASSLLNLPQECQNEHTATQQNSNKTKHMLEDVGTTNRRRCCFCYSTISQEMGRSMAIKKAVQTRWKCVQCDKFYCVTCFSKAHVCIIE